MKTLALFVCTICQALGQLVRILQRNPTGTMAVIAMLALVVIDVPLLVLMKDMLHG